VENLGSKADQKKFLRASLKWPMGILLTGATIEAGRGPARPWEGIQIFV
jgi:hypothetical protein